MKAEARPWPAAGAMRVVPVLFCFCVLLPGAAGRTRQAGNDLDSRWRYYLVHGLEAAGESGNEFLQQLTASTGAAGPALSEAFRDASRIIPFLVARRVLSWPENPAGQDLDHYTPVADRAPEDERLLQGMAGQPQVRSYLNDLNALALLARYHERKTAAAHSLALFEQSGDVAALRSAASSARAAADVWERLTALVANAPAVLFGSENAQYCVRDLRVSRGDLALIGQVEEAFRRYGLFDAAVSLGPERGDVRDQLAGGWRQGRLRLLAPGMSYSRERGFGWLSAQSIQPSGTGGLRGIGNAVLGVDLPDAQYRVIALVANQPELASGSFQIRAGPDAITYESGETGEKSMLARATGGRLDLTFVPGSGNDWLINGLVIARRAPHFGWIPPGVVGSEFSVTATVTAPDGIAEAAFSCIAPEGRALSVPLVADGAELTTRVRWPDRWRGKQVRCHFTAVDRRETSARFPASGDFTIDVR